MNSLKDNKISPFEPIENQGILSLFSTCCGFTESGAPHPLLAASISGSGECNARHSYIELPKLTCGTKKLKERTPKGVP